MKSLLLFSCHTIRTVLVFFDGLFKAFSSTAIMGGELSALSGFVVRCRIYFHILLPALVWTYLPNSTKHEKSLLIRLNDSLYTGYLCNYIYIPGVTGSNFGSFYSSLN
jgi:hypothetical protein